MITGASPHLVSDQEGFLLKEQALHLPRPGSAPVTGCAVLTRQRLLFVAQPHGHTLSLSIPLRAMLRVYEQACFGPHPWLLIDTPSGTGKTFCFPSHARWLMLLRQALDSDGLALTGASTG